MHTTELLPCSECVPPSPKTASISNHSLHLHSLSRSAWFCNYTVFATRQPQVASILCNLLQTCHAHIDYTPFCQRDPVCRLMFCQQGRPSCLASLGATCHAHNTHLIGRGSGVCRLMHRQWVMRPRTSTDSMWAWEMLEMWSRPEKRVFSMPTNTPYGSTRRTVPHTTDPTCKQARHLSLSLFHAIPWGTGQEVSVTCLLFHAQCRAARNTADRHKL